MSRMSAGTAGDADSLGPARPLVEEKLKHKNCHDRGQPNSCGPETITSARNLSRERPRPIYRHSIVCMLLYISSPKRPCIFPEAISILDPWAMSSAESGMEILIPGLYVNPTS